MGVKQIPIGIGPPNNLVLNMVQGDTNLDLTTVTGVTLSVMHVIDKSVSTWVCSVQSGATLTTMVAFYPFQVGDVVLPGFYNIAVNAITPGGPVPFESFQLNAVDQHILSLRSP